MLSRYRTIEKKDGDTGLWEPLGAVYERTIADGGLHALPVIGAGDQKVYWRDWEAIDKKAREYGLFGPSLEEYDKVFVDHADRYRLSTEIYTIEGDSYREIRDRLYQRYVLDPMRAREEEQKTETLTYERPGDRSFAKVRVVREQSKEEEE